MYVKQFLANSGKLVGVDKDPFAVARLTCHSRFKDKGTSNYYIYTSKKQYIFYLK